MIRYFLNQLKIPQSVDIIIVVVVVIIIIIIIIIVTTLVPDGRLFNCPLP